MSVYLISYSPDEGNTVCPIRLQQASAVLVKGYWWTVNNVDVEVDGVFCTNEDGEEGRFTFSEIEDMRI